MPEQYKLFSVPALRVPAGYYKNPPGKPIRSFRVTPIETRNEYNYLMMCWVVNPYRKRVYKKTLLQDRRQDTLSGYAQDLYESCFKNW